MELRKLDPTQDAVRVGRLFLQSADFVRLTEGVDPGPPQVAQFFKGVPPGGDLADSLKLGLFDGPVLLGIADLGYGYPEPDDAYLGLLLVAAEARGAGLGARVLAASEEVCRGNGMRRFLLAVLDANPRARAFWELAGFEAVIEGIPVQMGLRDHTAARMMKRLGGA